MGPGGGEGGERYREPGRDMVGVWGGTCNSEGGQASPISAVGDDLGEAGLADKDRGGCREKVVRRQSLDSVPEAVHACECSVCQG